MLTIRLARVGKTKQAQYRMVVADHRRAVTGRFIDVVGNVNPRTEPATVTLKKEEISDWLKKGAQPSETVRTILVRESLIEAPKNPAQRPSKAPKRPDKYGKAAPAPEASLEGEGVGEAVPEAVENDIEQAEEQASEEKAEETAEASEQQPAEPEQPAPPPKDDTQA